MHYLVHYYLLISALFTVSSRGLRCKQMCKKCRCKKGAKFVQIYFAHFWKSANLAIFGWNLATFNDKNAKMCKKCAKKMCKKMCKILCKFFLFLCKSFAHFLHFSNLHSIYTPREDTVSAFVTRLSCKSWRLSLEFFD